MTWFGSRSASEEMSGTAAVFVRWLVRAVGSAWLLSIAACSEPSAASGLGDLKPNSPAGSAGKTEGPTSPETIVETEGPSAQNVDVRVVDYSEAMRTATLKLIDTLPTLVDIKSLAGKSEQEQKQTYEAYVDKLLGDPRFQGRLVRFFRDTFKTGQPGMPTGNGKPSYDTAATFAAMVVVSDRPYTDLFTAESGTCPTLSNGAFAAADCPGAAPKAGLLTDPGLMSQFDGNMAFRRVRFVEEAFVCNKFPAEFGKATPMGAGLYTAPWPFESISGDKAGQKARVNFLDTSAVICANCHATLNHIAPLFANFDENGVYKETIQVKTPVTGNPNSVLSDWLPEGEGFAWRNGKPVTNLRELGRAIADDPEVARCAVTRIWNWAMSRGDVVDDIATVPPQVIDPYTQAFVGNGYKLKRTIRSLFTSPDFVRF